MTEPVIKATDLSIGYKFRNKAPRIISTGLNLQLFPGEMVCLLGPNGAGKSTLMRTIAGLQPTISGGIEIDGMPLAALDPGELAKKLSLVLTERIEAGNLSVGEVVSLGRIPYTGWLGKLSDLDQDKINWALSATETTIFQHQKINRLSDGERQKVMLARALAQDTCLILLDEPTAHLDLPSRVEMMRLLHQLARRMNKAILLSTHELDLALQAADKLWVMKNDGSLITGTPEDLVLNGSFEAAFTKSGFYFDKSSGSFTIHQEPSSLNVHVSGDSQIVFWIKRALQREGITALENESADIIINAKEDNGALKLAISCNSEIATHTSIESLINALNLLKRPLN
ncbi:ABC transporter ATP-binding protein [Dyadobacter sp. CY312]|uniref:ABC transporter ATP-binding protein n=1 Tax=Dyadobacter sp. CY312 TaxID=2907303 RepID=UPI001F167366|nr:ABC transporter ATP-binding protein [Dyadobacter sp. CY312]MCE7041041.1 ABC transporter ATP-binding protein [Dyadobacter sp. CY312]